MVSPTWDKDNRAKDWGESCEEIAVFHNEYANDLIPAVESRFSTYAETTDRAGIVASRDHRAFGGFSLGSVTTWYIFEHCFDLQRFFLPMSDYLRELTGRTDIPQASAVIMQYTGYGTVSSQDAATYACVGTNDGIASWRTMQRRLQGLSSLGIPTEFHAYDGLPHGFGLGTGTVAEGWLTDAVRFWEENR